MRALGFRNHRADAVCGSVAGVGGTSWKIWLYCSQMRYGIVLSPQALEDLRDLKADLRSQVRDALETHLRPQPTKTSKARIKRLRGLSRPQYRLRVGDVRVFFDVEGSEVRVLAIVSKVKAEEWWRKAGR